MMIIEIPNFLKSEINYVVHVIFGEFFGIPYTTIHTDAEHITIYAKDKNEKKIEINCSFFVQANSHWLKKESLSHVIRYLKPRDLPFLRKGFPFEKVPIFFGKGKESQDFIKNTDRGYFINFDIFGTSFILLTRYEEVLASNRDIHNRFPVSESIFKDYMDFPIVNIYLDILWSLIKSAWPWFSKKVRSFNVVPTHDVDRPFLYKNMTLIDIGKFIYNEIGNDSTINRALRHIFNWYKVKYVNFELDPYYTFNKILDLNEKYRLKSKFYFLTDKTSSYDGDYFIEDVEIINLIKFIIRRGHEVGLHGSYNSYSNLERLISEKKKLVGALVTAESLESEIGIRFHYLRWQNPDSWEIAAKAGFTYDTSVYFAERAGFRCGVCYEFPVYSVVERKMLKIRERPLVVMEGTIFSGIYMNRNLEDGLALILKLKDIVRYFDGDFIVLWHNNFFKEEKDFALYEKVISI